MKPLPTKLTSTLAVFLFLSAAQIASAFYDPSLGRWLTRDPVKEKGGPNLYTFVANTPTVHIDALGEMKFEGCDGKEDEIKEDMEKKCAKLDDNFAKCLGHCNLPGRLKWMCDNKDNLTIKCESSNSGSCNNSCGWSLPFGLSQTIHLCPSQFSDPRCGDPGCTLLHEMTHMTGHPGEKWPDKVEQCLGCGQ